MSQTVVSSIENFTRRVIFCLLGFVPVVCALLLSGCDSEPEIAGEQLVIDGYISSDGEIRVYLTKSVSGSVDEGNLEDAVVRWGKVEVSCEGEQTVLIGRPSSLTIPPYVYSAHDLAAEPGKLYRIEATYGGAVATAECRMPPLPPQYLLESKEVTDDSRGRIVEIEFETPRDCPAWFMVLVADEAHPGRLLPLMGGVVEALEPGKKIRIPLYPPRSDFDAEDTPMYFEEGRVIYVELVRISRPVYDFWLAYDEAVSFSNGLFIGILKSLPTNVSGGLGVWSAQSTAGIRRFVP